MTKKDLIAKVVEELGYKLDVDSEGRLFICFQMKEIYIIGDDEDDQYLVLLLPQFYDLDENEVPVALTACNKITREVKMVKTYIDKNFKSVSASCEFFYTDEPSLKLLMENALFFLSIVSSVFRRTLKELSENE